MRLPRDCSVSAHACVERVDHLLLIRLGNAIGRRSAAALVREARGADFLKRSEEPPNLTLASVKTTRRLGLRHACVREPRDDRQCVHFSRAQGEKIAGHGAGLNPEPDIYAWGRSQVIDATAKTVR